MNPNTLEPTISLIVKSLVLLGLSIYAIFSFVMVRQEHLMASVLEERFEPFLKLLIYIHFFLSLALIVFAFIVL